MTRCRPSLSWALAICALCGLSSWRFVSQSPFRLVVVVVDTRPETVLEGSRVAGVAALLGSWHGLSRNYSAVA